MSLTLLPAPPDSKSYLHLCMLIYFYENKKSSECLSNLIWDSLFSFQAKHFSRFLSIEMKTVSDYEWWSAKRFRPRKITLLSSFYFLGWIKVRISWITLFQSTCSLMKSPWSEAKFKDVAEIKFRQSEKATKFEKNLPLVLTLHTVYMWEIFSNFVAFSENVSYRSV